MMRFVFSVSLGRLSTYLNEDEVDEQVSTLKMTNIYALNETAGGLGLDHATFKWNEIEERRDKDKAKDTVTKPSASINGSSTEDDSATAVDSTSVADVADVERRFELTNASVMFPEGELTVITGPTGSGKTALLMALLGEMTLLEGRIIMSKNPGKVDEHGLQHAISYAAQTPWLRHQSIKDNILFGYPLNEERYQAVVECCALRPDLHILEDGDSTEIGARGVSLSGGQKARVALARAVYAPTKYVLLDDPLSAVDSHTARFLFEKLLRGPLLANRTVILVTHHVELVLPGTYYVVRMLDGHIDTQGTVKELRSRGVLDDITHDEAIEAHKEQQAVEVAPAEKVDGPSIDAEEHKPVEQTKRPRKLIEDEKRETGAVKWNIYKTYLKASSYWTWAILGFLIVLNQLLGVSEKVWIKVWGAAYGPTNSTTGVFTVQGFMSPVHEYSVPQSYPTVPTLDPSSPGNSATAFAGNRPPAQDYPFFYIGIYALITFGGAFANIFAAIAQYTGALRASRILFKRLLVAVVRATMRWHDITPQGRMLNRFSKDVETVDVSLASSLQQLNTSLAGFAASAITIVVVFPLFIFPATLIGYVYRKLAVGYLNTGRDLRRMESNSRSPIFANFGELLEGIVTVRAFSSEQCFLDNHNEKIDLSFKVWYMYWMTNRWLLLRFDALGALAVLITTLFALSGYVDAGLAGVCITSAMSFMMSMYWTCRNWTGLELDLNSVERVVEYLDLPQEPPAIIESSRPPAYWPSSSGPNKDALIYVENLVVKEGRIVGANGQRKVNYGDEFIALCKFGPAYGLLHSTKIRKVEPTSGKIVVDGIDISQIGIYDLRSRITFIPQDATLFSGTLRDNLDPFSEHEDSECLDVLYRVQLITENQLVSRRTSREPSRTSSIHNVEREGTIASSTGTESDNKVAITLETQVSPGGSNFSQGQRQLIAMARALLRRSTILILDEATSSIDFATDAKIQATIREEFNDSALLTVAHRLRTVIDYDRLIVLDQGELAEFDTPWNLIQKEGGIFRAKAKAEADTKRA
ncbi:hypothetical protein EIP86_003243 [Pleurotus ostreatoroseus]|nr:hypothetical protein EIP86_003243 [Pleurotus ostreatoroseus]